MKYVLIILGVILIGNILSDRDWKRAMKMMEENRDE